MFEIHRTALVPYSAVQMFDLIDDIEAYPDFLPWCRTARVIERTETDVTASLKLAKGGIEKTFTTLNRAIERQGIEIRLVEGPFKDLHGRWQFQQLGYAGCRVTLDLSFEFKNPLLRMTLGPIFNPIAGSLVDAFVARARSVYSDR